MNKDRTTMHVTLTRDMSDNLDAAATLIKKTTGVPPRRTAIMRAALECYVTWLKDGGPKTVYNA